MKILLVNPLLTMRYDKGRMGVEDKNVVESTGEFMYPYSLVYLSNYLINNGYSVDIIDLYMKSKKYLFEYVTKEKPDIIGYTGVTNNRFDVIDLIDEVSEISKDSLVVVGGRHFSHTSKQTLEMNPNIDIVVRGEGELTLLDLVKNVEGENRFDNILGITHRDGFNLDRPVEKNLDNLAINRENLPEGYSKYLTMRNYEKEGIKSIPMMCGRGCTESCVFCVHRFIKYRMRSIDIIVDEIEDNIELYNNRYFSFNDPSIYCDKRWMKNFCYEILNRNLDIKWYCEGRVDIPLDLLELMSEAGCISLDVGIESGSPKILKSIRKNIKTSMFLPFAEKANELGIRSKMFFMVSLPDETEEDALMTLNIAKELSRYVYRVGCAITLIFPGTTLEEIAIQKGLFSENFDWYDRDYKNYFSKLFPSHDHIPFYIEHLSSDFIVKFLRKFGIINVNIALKNKDFWRIALDIYGRSSKMEFLKRSLKLMRGIIE